MPRFSRWAIRTACLYLCIGGTIGGLILANKAIPFWPWIWHLRSTHIAMMLIGWMAHLIFGVAFWMLPRLDPAGGRGDERLAWVAYGLLNAGVALMAAASLARDLAWCAVAAGVAQAAAAALMLRHCWPRVGPVFERHQRQQGGDARPQG